MGNEVAKAGEYTVDPNSIKELVTSAAGKKQFAMALPKHLSADRFLRVALTAFTRTPKLLQCTKASLTESLMDCSALGLEPDGRKAHLLPYWNKRLEAFECKLIVDYKGLVNLARRSGEIADIHADVVGENDFFEYSFGNDGHLEHKPAIKGRGEVIAAYSYVKLKDGSSSYEVMNLEEIEAIHKRSKSADSGPWVTDWNEMAKKTVFRRHSKWLPVSSELMKKASDKDYDVPIDLMPYAEDAGKPEVSQPKALSDEKMEPENTTEPEKKEKPAKEKEKPENAFATMIKDFGEIKKMVGDKIYYETLGRNSFEHANQIKKIKDGEAIVLEMLAAKKESGK